MIVNGVLSMTATTIASTSEKTLLERAVSGDVEAFEEIVRCHQQQIYRVALAIVRDEVEADTVTQDTFIQAYRHLPRFEGRSGLETWLTRIAINRARDTLRKRKRWVTGAFGSNHDGDPALDPSDARPDAERLVRSNQLRQALGCALESLSDQQRVIFQLRHFEGLALEEIATMLGLKAGTVRAHLFRAVHKLRDELGSWVDSATEGTS